MLARAPRARHILRPIAGSQLKRQRKAGVRDEDGRIIAFPYMPRVADLPRDWRRKKERLPCRKRLVGRGADKRDRGPRLRKSARRFGQAANGAPPLRNQKFADSPLKGLDSNF